MIGRQDLLDHQVHRLVQQLRARTQQIAVPDRIEQAVDVVDSKPVDVAASDQLEHEPVRVAEAVRVFHTQRGQGVDVEETPVVDFLGGDLPRRRAPVLGVDHPLDERFAFGRGARLVERPHVCARAVRFGLGEQTAQRGGGLAPGGAVGDRLERREERRERGQRRRSRAVEHQRVRRRRERKTVLEVAQREAAVDVLPAQVTGVEDSAVLLTEKGQQHLSAQLRTQRPPVDVEIVGVVRVLAPGQQVEPPGVVVAADPHVVGHEVQDVPHPVRAQRVDERAVLFGRADLGIERTVVDDVVPVRRAGARAQVRRRVDVRDPQRREVRDQRGRIGEAEAGMELQPVRRARRHESRNQPTLHGLSVPPPAPAGTSPSVKTGAPEIS